jgi:SNF2 family DNA or RNA helicase
MIVLHAAAGEDEIHLWAEQSVGENGTGRDSAESALRSHPFARPVDELRGLMHALGINLIGADTLISCQLPTFRGKPLASTALVDDSLDRGVAARLSVWRIPAVVASPEGAAALFARAAEQRVIEPGLVAGDDLRFWSAALAFAVGLVTRERFLPGLRQRNKQWYAVWEPVIAGDDLDRFTQLVGAAPDVCRVGALRADEKQTGALQAIHAFVSLYVDHFARSAAAGTSGAKPPPNSPANNIHDRWLKALHSPVGSIEATAEEMHQLQSDLARWKRTINSTVTSDFRLCFKLDEPEVDPVKLQRAAEAGDEQMDVTNGIWKLSYLVQSTADQSLLLPADSVWSGRELPRGLERTTSGAREYLLGALGTAASIYAPVERSLLSAQPQSAELSAEEAYKFLHEHSQLLQQAGFKVMLPSWFRKRAVRATAALKSFNTKGKSKLSLDQIVQFEWKLAIGDQTLTRQELEAVAAAKVPLVRLRGQWVELDPEQVKQALEYLKKSGKAMTLRELLMLSVGAKEPAGTLLFDGVTGGGFLEELFEGLQGERKFAEIATPGEFHGTLRPYQQRGYSWLNFMSQWGLGACLADDMGLGKTVQALALLEKHWHETAEEDRKPVLLVCPMSVVGNWQREAERFSPDLPILVHHGGTRKKGSHFADSVQGKAIVLCSYGLIHRDRDSLFQVDWAGVILDEAQNIKNPHTQHAKVARLLKADYKLALTGTPVENNVGDLWSIMEFLNPGLLGNQAQFKQRFLVPIQVDGDKEAVETLAKLTGPFILRRLKTDKSIIKDLPEKLEMKDFCNLTREQATLYQAVVRETEEALAQEESAFKRKGLVLSTLSQLKQICNHPALFLHDHSALANRSGKLSRLTSMIEESLQINDRMLVFTQFAEMGELIKQHLQEVFGIETLFLHGSVSKTRRDQMVERFQNAADAPAVFILSLKAGGVGLNLTRANQVVHYDRWWNPAVENQATDRAFRIGQTRTVQVHKFLCTGTVEEKIDQIIEQKTELAASIVGTGESWLAKLDDKQLKELFKLSKEAIAE